MDHEFRDTWRAVDRNKIAALLSIIPGLGLYMHERPDALHAQLDRCADWGGDFALFSYASLYPTQEDRNRAGGPTPKDQAARQTRRQVLNQFARPAPAR